MATFTFDVTLTRFAAQDALGQDVMMAQADAGAYKNSAVNHRAEAIRLESEAAHFEELAVSYTAQAKDLYRSFMKALDEAKADSVNKSVIKLSYSHEDQMRRQAVFSAIEGELWAQYISSKAIEQDLQDLRDFKGDQRLTPVELLNEYATNNKAESFRLLEKARTHREESSRLFVKADQTLIDGGLGSIVEDNKNRARAKKELEKGVKNFGK